MLLRKEQNIDLVDVQYFTRYFDFQNLIANAVENQEICNILRLLFQGKIR